MRKLFITVCELDEISYLPKGIETEIFGAPLYEHAYRKIKDASNKLGLDMEFVRAATFPIKGATNTLNPDYEDIVAVVSPLVFLANAESVENALSFVVDNDTAYATVGSLRGLFAVRFHEIIKVLLRKQPCGAGRPGAARSSRRCTFCGGCSSRCRSAPAPHRSAG